MTVNVLPFPSNITTFTQPGINHNGVSCVDLNGRSIPAGVHYVPGPDECTLCVCAEEGPIWCKAVLCSPPQDCKSFRVGNSCCEFICLDDTINGGKGNGGTTGGPFGPVDISEVVPKIVIASVCSMLSLALLSFLVYRLRQRHIQGRLNSAEACHSAQMCDECDDTRSLDFSNDCYFERPAGAHSNFFPPHYLALWKPPTFPPTNEAPPPYEEIENSHCVHPLPSYMTSSFNAAAINSTILTNENINQVPSQNCQSQMRTNGTVDAVNSVETQVICESTSSGSSAPTVPHLVNGQSPKSTESIPKCRASCSKTNSTNMTNGITTTDQGDPLQGPSSNSLNFNRASTIILDPPEQQQNGTVSTVDTDPPNYSVSNYRDCFRHSLNSLPRNPRNILDLDSEYALRQQQRFSLQFNVADWSSSSSTLSLSTPNTPLPLDRPESSTSSSSTSSASNPNNNPH